MWRITLPVHLMWDRERESVGGRVAFSLMKTPISAGMSAERWLSTDIDGDARGELVGSAQIAANVPEVVKTTLQERVWCIFEEVDNCPVPQFLKKNLEVIKGVPQECSTQRPVEQTIDVPVPQTSEETAVLELQAGTLEVIPFFPDERIAEHIIEETFPQERISERTQPVDMLVSHFFWDLSPTRRRCCRATAKLRRGAWITGPWSSWSS